MATTIQDYISDVTLPNSDKYPIRAAAIPYGEVDSTSTSTVYTATVKGIYNLKNGVVVYLRNNVITSASNFTININGLGAKPVYSSLDNATAESTIFNKDYTMMFIYNENRITGGCWDCFKGYVYPVPSAATATPLMDGTAAVGTSGKWAKEDHRHPTDTTRASQSAIDTTTFSDTFVSAWIGAGSTLGQALEGAYTFANSKQAKLVSGTNIKTINGTSLLGSGDITIGGAPSAIDSSTIHTKAVAGWGSVANITSGEGVQF